MTETQFERMRDRIDLETSRAADHLRLLQGLVSAREEYPFEMNESNTFWHLTLKAHLDAVLSHLCRLYDKTKGTLSLGRFLRSVKAHPEFFSDTAFRARLKENPDVDTLVADHTINEVELEAEITSISDAEGLVARLLECRNKVLSHLDAERIIQNVPTAGLTAEDIEKLLRRAGTITSKYSLLFRASVYGGIVGADDFKSTLGWVRAGLAAHHAEIDEQIKRASTPEPHLAVAQLMTATRTFLDGLDLIPRKGVVDAILLGLLSKSILVTEAVGRLVEHDHADEAFALCRTCIEIQLTLRYLTNKDTEKRCSRYLRYFAKDASEWFKLYGRHYPDHPVTRCRDAIEIEKVAGEYRSAHKWAEVELKAFASEEDSFERAADGSPLTEVFSYEIAYKWMSHYVHGTVRCIDPVHVTGPGERFRMHARKHEQLSRLGLDNLALMFAFQSVQFNMTRIMRSFNMEWPDHLYSQYLSLGERFKPRATAYP